MWTLCVIGCERAFVGWHSQARDIAGCLISHALHSVPLFRTFQFKSKRRQWRRPVSGTRFRESTITWEVQTQGTVAERALEEVGQGSQGIRRRSVIN